MSSSIDVTEEVSITTSKDILSLLGTSESPDNFLVALGYAGWDAGQLEQELIENVWLTTEANTDVVFNTPINERWNKAIAQLGISATHLSTEQGHA